MPERMLPLYLWDLRAQVEAKLRSLTDVQRLLEALPTAPPATRQRHAGKIVKDLTDIMNANAAVREVTAAALAEAQTLLEVTRA